MLPFLIISVYDLLLLLLLACIKSPKESNGISEAIFLFSVCPLSLALLALMHRKNGSDWTCKPIIKCL